MIIGAVIELCGVSRAYETGDGVIHALRDVDLAFGRGEFVAIVGPPGSGKSTLLNILGAIEAPTEGTLRIDGEEVTPASAARLATYRRHTVAHIFQESSLFPSLSVLENVRLGAEVAGRPEADGIARTVLADVGLADRTTQFPARLSEAERQQVAIARAIASGNPVVLADEPTRSLDRPIGLEMLDLFHRQVTVADRAVVLATQDRTLARLADRVIELDDGAVRADARRVRTDRPGRPASEPPYTGRAADPADDEGAHDG